MEWMTTEQNPAFQGGRSSHGGDCSVLQCDVGVWSLALWSQRQDVGPGDQHETRRDSAA